MVVCMNSNIPESIKNNYEGLIDRSAAAKKMLNSWVPWSHGFKIDYQSYKAPEYRSYVACEILKSGAQCVFLGSLLVIYHLGQALIVGLYKVVICRELNYLLSKTFCIIRDIEQMISYAAVGTCFFRKWGHFHLEQANFQRSYYSNYLEIQPRVNKIKRDCDAEEFIFDSDELLDVEKHLKIELIQYIQGQVKSKKGKVISSQQLMVQADGKIEEFKKRAHKTLSEKIHLESLPECKLNREQELKLSSFNWLETKDEDIKFVRGGGNLVYFLKTVPDWVFKPMDSEEEMNEYINISVKAREITQKENLYLLFVPKSQPLKIDGKFFIAQEKVELMSPHPKDIRGLYDHCWDQEEMQSYIECISQQLLIFICLTKFSDVKYDNIPFTKDGRIPLFDLDQRSIIGGLTRGGSQKTRGFFNALPSNKIDKFVELAKEKLSNTVFEELEKKMIEIKKRAEKKFNKNKEYAEFLTNKSISSSLKPIKMNDDHIKNHKEKRTFQMFIKMINEELATRVDNPTPLVARKVYLYFNTSGQIMDNMKKIYGNNYHYQNAKTTLIEVLKRLKAENCIYKHEFKDDNFKIWC